MKVFRKAACLFTLLAVVSVFPGVSCADYKFDDLLGNGFTSQWVVIDGNSGTFGGKYDEAIQVSTDVLRNNDDFSVVRVLNGHSETEIEDRELHVLFLVLADGMGRFYMDMKGEDMDFDISTPNPGFSTIGTQTHQTYTNAIQPEGPVDGLDGTWRRFAFTLQRSQRQTYDSVVQHFTFHQNPRIDSSQTVTRPVIISNVAKATASDVPLILRMTLRDGSARNSNVVAYDYAEWDMRSNKTAGKNHWVFVPVNDDLLIDNSRINYYLTTEVTNHTSIRYAATTYDAYGDYTYPDYWKFDLDRSQGTTYVDSEIQLAPLSHVAPGLVSVYKRKYNINEQNKRPLILYPIDSYETGSYELRLDHRVILGKRLGEYKEPAREGNFNSFEIMAFQPKVASNTFYDQLKEITKATGEVRAPTTSLFSASSVERNEMMPSTVLQHLTVDQSIPGNLRTNNNEGMLPLHITFNIPVTLIDDRNWLNDVIARARSGERLEDTFAEKYHLYLMAETDGQENIWNLTQELDRKDQYNKQIKVFFDGERGRSGTDNDKGVITVSLIAMLMDGTRDGVRPELSIVEDHSITTDNEYIIIRDGNKDDKWRMTFFVAPAGYKDNANAGASSSEEVRPTKLGSSGGGGCISVRSEELGVRSVLVLLALCFLAFARGGKRHEH